MLVSDFSSDTNRKLCGLLCGRGTMCFCRLPLSIFFGCPKYACGAKYDDSQEYVDKVSSFYYHRVGIDNEIALAFAHTDETKILL